MQDIQHSCEAAFIYMNERGFMCFTPALYRGFLLLAFQPSTLWLMVVTCSHVFEAHRFQAFSRAMFMRGECIHVLAIQKASTWEVMEMETLFCDRAALDMQMNTQNLFWVSDRSPLISVYCNHPTDYRQYTWSGWNSLTRCAGLKSDGWLQLTDIAK